MNTPTTTTARWEVWHHAQRGPMYLRRWRKVADAPTEGAAWAIVFPLMHDPEYSCGDWRVVEADPFAGEALPASDGP